MDSEAIADRIRRESRRLGFCACGMAKAEPVDALIAEDYRLWIESKGNATMSYLANYMDIRLNPLLLMPGAKSIICLALSYAPKRMMDPMKLHIASYAYGSDYHVVMRSKLYELAKLCGLGNYRICCDTTPILEKYWAQRAGTGWIGRNRQLIVPGAGSFLFLGEIITDIDLPYDKPSPNRCPRGCRKCIESCPTGALGYSSDKSELFDSSLCLSYQTIENRGELSENAARNMGECFYGCDRCLLACPFNRDVEPSQEPDFQPITPLLDMSDEDWQNLTPQKYKALFKNSAVRRAKYEQIVRNIKASRLRTDKDDKG